MLRGCLPPRFGRAVLTWTVCTSAVRVWGISVTLNRPTDRRPMGQGGWSRSTCWSGTFLYKHEAYGIPCFHCYPAGTLILFNPLHIRIPQRSSNMAWIWDKTKVYRIQDFWKLQVPTENFVIVSFNDVLDEDYRSWYISSVERWFHQVYGRFPNIFNTEYIILRLVL